MEGLIKFPRTPHIKGSNIQLGDEDLKQFSFDRLAGKHVVIEEKIDGANTAISFSPEGELLIQNRGHYLAGGYKEKHYALLKQWASVWENELFNLLLDRYIMYGEWMYAKHSVFYDKLPHYFMEFDIYDRERGVFLDTPSRRALIGDLPIISVPVLKEGQFSDLDEALTLLTDSNFISPNNVSNLHAYCNAHGINTDYVDRQTDLSGKMEGLYLKLEEDGQVRFRAKYVRPSFIQTIEESDSHWSDRQLIPNQLSVPVESLFEVS